MRISAADQNAGEGQLVGGEGDGVGGRAERVPVRVLDPAGSGFEAAACLGGDDEGKIGLPRQPGESRLLLAGSDPGEGPGTGLVGQAGVERHRHEATGERGELPSEGDAHQAALPRPAFGQKARGETAAGDEFVDQDVHRTQDDPLMRILPVLDIKAGRAVHAIAGRRAEYRPLAGPLYPSSDPLAIAADFRDRLGLAEVYLADLDAIAGGPPSLDLYRAFRDRGHRIWLDAGVASAEGVAALRAHADRLILGLETLQGASALGRIADEFDPGDLVFSLDLRDGEPILAAGSDWPDRDPEAIVREALNRGIRRVILLDLARVGTGRGVGTLDLLIRLTGGHQDVEWIVGGGISTPLEIEALARAGASAVLVGSALHDRRIGPREVARLSSGIGAPLDPPELAEGLIDLDP